MKLVIGVSALCLTAYTIAGLVSTKVVKNCTDSSQCHPGQCCQKLSRFRLVSKRDADVEDDTLPGTCQSYISKNDHCNIFDEYNGYCSCEPGTKCTGSEQRKRSPRMVGGNAVYKCLEVK